MRCVGTAESALTRVYTRSCSGKLFCWSEIWNELRQLNPKILIGVSNDAVVARWFRRTCELSIAPRLSAYRYPKFPNSSTFSVSLLLPEKLGVQVNHLPMLTGFDDKLSVGNTRSISERPGYCFCVPPRLKLAGPSACW
jgi:hypothetical protein